MEQVVHYNRLKQCAPGTCFEQEFPEPADDSEGDLPSSTLPAEFGRDRKPLDDDPDPPVVAPEEPHYPRRNRQKPTSVVTGCITDLLTDLLI